jgi:hypothetical protein
MKNVKLLVLSILLLSGLNAAAQGDSRANSQSNNQSNNLYAKRPLILEPERYHFILEMGYIGAGTTEASDASDLQHGFSGGFLFDFYGKNYFNLESGVFITQQAFSYASKDLAAIDSNDVSNLSNFIVVGKVTYVGIPLLGKINFTGNPLRTPFLIGGVSPQILLSKDVSVQAKDRTTSESKTFTPNTNKFEPPAMDVAGIIGLGGSFGFSDTQSILIQATYNRGLIPVDYRSEGIYNQSFLFTLGFGVDL